MKSSLPSKQRLVPVVSSTGLPLMPCHSIKLERRQARRNQALLRSSLRGRNFLPVLKDGVSGSLYE